MTLDKPAEAIEALREAVRMAPDLLDAKNQFANRRARQRRTQRSLRSGGRQTGVGAWSPRGAAVFQ